MTSRLQHFRSSLLIAALVSLWISGGAAQPAPASAGPPDPKLVEDLVAAGRILADHGLLDGWGHVSVRHNLDPNRFLMSRGLSAELVTEKDILEFDLDSRPVDTEEAIRITNDSAYGLGGAVYTADLAKGLEVAKRLRTGTVNINGAVSLLHTPFGGFKESGIGREGGRWGFDEYTEIQAIAWR